MASPQLEKGHTRIANEIMEAIVKSNLSGTELRATLWIIRLTYGFQRKEMTTNVNAFATKLATTRHYVKELFGNLEAKKVITCEWASTELCKVIFNKDFDKWKCFL